MDIILLSIKKTITLFALVEPLAMIPLFLSVTEGQSVSERKTFARSIALSVTIALLVAAFLGVPFLGLLGVSIGAMQVGGGIIVLLLSVAMVLGKEANFKGAHSDFDQPKQTASVVPLAIPLLAGPASFSYVMGNSQWTTTFDVIHVVLPIVIVGLVCWVVFKAASSAEKAIKKSSLDMVERISGFILSAMAIEMISVGLKALFPTLAA